MAGAPVGAVAGAGQGGAPADALVLGTREGAAAARAAGLSDERHQLLQCSGCRAVFYCDLPWPCQKEAWPKHKSLCAELEAAMDEAEVGGASGGGSGGGGGGEGGEGAAAGKKEKKGKQKKKGKK